MIRLDKCPLCNSQNIKFWLKSNDYSTSKKDFSIYRCEGCTFTFTNPRPYEKNIGEYYLSDSYLSHTNKKKGLFNTLYQLVRKKAIKSKTNLLQKTTKTKHHLDIGCGTGEFLNACKKSGIKTVGIEPSKNARKMAMENYQLDVRENTDINQFDNNTFDSLSMWHVLEHIYDINNTVKSLSKIIKNNGYAIIAVPNHKSYDAKFYKKYWAAWDLPIHLNHFCPITVVKLFKENGFSMEKKIGMKYDSFYVSLLSNEYKSGRKQYIKGFIVGLISNILAYLNLYEFSSTIYIFKNHK